MTDSILTNKAVVAYGAEITYRSKIRESPMLWTYALAYNTEPIFMLWGTYNGKTKIGGTDKSISRHESVQTAQWARHVSVS